MGLSVEPQSFSGGGNRYFLTRKINREKRALRNELLESASRY